MEKPTYLYHGSSNCLNLIEPRQAYDWGFEEGNQLAVYATSKRNIALCFALGQKADKNGECERIMDSKFGKKIQMIFWKGTPNFGGKGYVYKLSSKNFIYASGTQWICKSTVKPIEIEEIDVNNYLHLFRFASMEEKLELEKEYIKSNTPFQI